MNNQTARMGLDEFKRATRAFGEEFREAVRRHNAEAEERECSIRKRSSEYLDKVLASLESRHQTTQGVEHTLIGQCITLVTSIKGRNSIKGSTPIDAQNLINSRWYGDYVLTGFMEKEEAKKCFKYIREIMRDAFEGA